MLKNCNEISIVSILLLQERKQTFTYHSLQEGELKVEESLFLESIQKKKKLLMKILSFFDL